jgi:hypothetical protein
MCRCQRGFSISTAWTNGYCQILPVDKESCSFSSGIGEVKEDGLLCSSFPTEEDDSREGRKGLWCWSKLPRVVESIEGLDIVAVPPVLGRLRVDVDDGLDGGRNGDCSFSISPHSVGGEDEGAKTICWRGLRFGTAAVPVADGNRVKTHGCGAVTLRRAEIDGTEDGRSVVLVELELDGAVKRDNGEGGTGVCLCEGVVIGV